MAAFFDSGFQRNMALENLLTELNDLLSGSEERVLKNYQNPQFPVVLIVGAPRSGTTLLSQWLASSAQFGYPSNFISRFFNAPYIGAKIQRMIFDPQFAFRNELVLQGNDGAKVFKSKLGKTEGLLSPHEFWYFWRRFFPYGEIQKLNDDELNLIDHQAFVAELAALEAAFEKPLALKALIINWNIEYITKILPQAFFLYIHRNLFFNIHSLIQARNAYFGDTNRWYSFKPPQYEMLREFDVYSQVTGQVVYTNRAVREGLASVDNEHQLEISYEALCKNPEAVWQQLTKKLNKLDAAVPTNYVGQKSFACSNKVQSAEKEQIKATYRKLFHDDLILK